jgi:hypothetical protein
MNKIQLADTLHHLHGPLCHSKMRLKEYKIINCCLGASLLMDSRKEGRKEEIKTVKTSLLAPLESQRNTL